MEYGELYLRNGGFYRILVDREKEFDLLDYLPKQLDIFYSGWQASDS